MNTLPLLLAGLLAAQFAVAQGESRRSVPASSSPRACAQCTKAPCRCGFSPSYYTHYRRPVPYDPSRVRPITPHWTHPHPANLPAVSPGDRVSPKGPTHRRPRTPTAAPRQPRRALTVHGTRGSRGWGRPFRCSSPHSRQTGNPGHQRMASPRNARIAIGPVPRQSLGYDPHRSWVSRRTTAFPCRGTRGRASSRARR